MMGLGLGGMGVRGGKRRVILILFGRWNSAVSSGGIFRLRDGGCGLLVVVVERVSKGQGTPVACDKYQTVVPFLQVPGVEQ
jgi:hypothetical protein